METYSIREMMPDDIDTGLPESLDALRPTSMQDHSMMRRVCDMVCADPYQTMAVAVHKGMVVGAATLLIEHKIIHNGGLAGHIEDVAVHVEHQKHGVGTLLVRYLLDLADQRGCYRTTLDCQVDIMGFYVNLGFQQNGVHMRFDHK